MPLSNAPALCDAASLESARRLFQRLFERLASFVADVPNANERANAAVKALGILQLERRFFSASTFDLSKPLVDDWRRRVEQALEAVERDVLAVESRSERAYLRRLAIDATLALNACDATFFTERFADAFLAEIDDAEERQNALVAYATRLAARIARFPKNDGSERAKAFAALDEIEDLRLFERAAADVVAAVVFNATQCNDAPNVATNDDATLDLTPFGNDVAEAWEQFESPGGFLELCERANAELFPIRPSLPPTPREVALRRALNAETRRRLEALLTALDGDVDLEGSPLDEDARDELQNVVDETIVESPFALENGEFFRAFFERSRNLDAFFPIFERLDEAEKASLAPVDAPQVSDASSPTPDVNIGYRSFYTLTSSECAEEKSRWLETARRVVAHSDVFDADLYVKLDRLTTYAELEFQFGDKTNGKDAVRKALGLLPRLNSPFERAHIYRRLVALHISSSYPKTAQKLATLLKTEIDAIEPDDLRDAGLVDAFELYTQAVKFDAKSISAFIDSLASRLARLECETQFKTKLLFSQPVTSNAIEEIANLVDSALNSLATFDETAPDEAVFTFVKIATGVADSFRPLFQTI